MPPPSFPAGTEPIPRIRVEDDRYTGTCEEMGPDPVWDARVAGTPGGSIVQTGRWAASRNRLGFKSYRITVNEADGTLVAGCLMYAKRLGPGTWAGAIPYGPLSFGNRPFRASDVVRTVVALSRQRGIRFLVIQPPDCGWAFDEALAVAGFRTDVPAIAPEATLRVDLTRSRDEILAAMSTMRRRNLRKAWRAGFDVSEERDPAVFHRLHVATAMRQGFNPVTIGNLQAQYDTLAPDFGKLFVARLKGRPVAGLWLTHFAGTVTLKLAGWDAAGHRYANDAVHWATVEYGWAAGAHTYDLGGFDRRSAERLTAGQPLPEDFEKTPSFFKLGFGGTPVLLPRARFAFTHPAANVAFGAVARKVLTTPALRWFLQRLRNG
ncbi:MAG TPA: GNAT family N-acetyltransferase [Azospirillaceae bacterium]|nr:GNAT family N-acetyltransferase [Azospirillaceae bacterium]